MPTRYHDNKFPPASLDWTALIPLLGPAHAAVARFDGLLSAIPNADILLSPLSRQEAVLSSRIEGTQATMSEVLEFEASGKSAKYNAQHRADIQEVLNYRHAMHEARLMLEEVPLSQRVMKHSHAILLSGVRGENKAPGEYRRTPNWIGPPSCTEEEAYFVPISADKLGDAMSAWEKFLHADYGDTLIQLALAHVEFEAIHPFLDGNGRLGRMLIPLFLWQKGLLSHPVFYISAFFEAHRESYYARLRAVSHDGAWTAWCQFFLEAIRVQAEENTEKSREILTLYDGMKQCIPEITSSKHVIKILDWIFTVPLFQTVQFCEHTEISAQSARRILSALCEYDVLKVLSPASGRQATTYCFAQLINIAEGKEVF